ncbi:MAG: 2-hydroxyacyl-CoA dehydratase subunit D [Dethiobacteria bacterium]|jgi:benzoyl-CoA reductase/2-hydroxyglutaryl-CoA dehydratase subunit BcrC/BadD/HgdB
MSFWGMVEEKEECTKSRAGRMAWLCSYTPVEIISCCGLLPYRIFAAHNKSFYGSSLLHTTLCPYVRGALDELLQETERDLEGAVLVHSCNAIFHLYHALVRYSKLPFTYLLDLPRDSSPQAIAFYADSLQKFHATLSAHCGIQAREDDLWEQIYLYAENRSKLMELYRNSALKGIPDGSELIRLVRSLMILPAQDFQQLFQDYYQKKLQEEYSRSFQRGPRIFLTGSMAPFHLIKMIRELGGRIVLDDLCNGKRAVDFSERPAPGENPYQYLARLYLKRAPCARMKHAAEQIVCLNGILQDHDLAGIIFFYLKFCDSWYYYGQLLKEKLHQVPVLVLEAEEMESGVTGQQRTRIAAFLEMLQEAGKAGIR